MAVNLGAPWGGLQEASEAAVVAVLLSKRCDNAERPMPPQPSLRERVRKIPRSREPEGGYVAWRQMPSKNGYRIT